LEFGCLVVRAIIAMADLASPIQIEWSWVIAINLCEVPKKSQKVWVEMTKGGCDEGTMKKP
jgi:hypothetical protein